MDQIIFPVILILAGMLTASRLLLRVFPFMHGVTELLSRFRSFLGVIALLAGIIELFLFPLLSVHPARTGAIILALVIGLTLTIDMFLSSRHSRRENLPFVWLGNALLYIRDYTGLLAVFLGLIYIFIV